jgi:hypothetical protein
MTRTDLEKYHDIVVRLNILQTTVVTDSVVGSSPDYPYVAHSVTIHGIRKDDAAVKEVNQLTQKKAALDAYIDGIEDERVKTIVELRIRKSLSWVQIGQRMSESPDAVRMQYTRMFEK